MYIIHGIICVIYNIVQYNNPSFPKKGREFFRYLGQNKNNRNYVFKKYQPKNEFCPLI